MFRRIVSLAVLMLFAVECRAQCANGVCLVQRPVAAPPTVMVPVTRMQPYDLQRSAVAPIQYRTPIRSFLFGSGQYPTPLRSRLGGTHYQWNVYDRRR